MNPQQNTAPVRKVRTFADDMRRAQGITDTPAAPKKKFSKQIMPSATQSAAPNTPKDTTATPQSAKHSDKMKQELQQAIEGAAAKKPPAEHTTKEAPGKSTIPKRSDAFAKPPSHLENTENVFDIKKQLGEKQEGTIVTDMQHNRWSLTKEVGKSLVGWVNDKKEEVEDITEPKKPPRPNVAPAATRADVIKQAGAKSYIAPQDDHKKVVQRLRTFASDSARATGKSYNTNTQEEQAVPPQTTAANIEAQHTPTTALGKAVQQHVADEVHRGNRSIKEARTSIQPDTPKQQRAPQYTRADVMPKELANTVAPEAAQTIPDQEFVREKTVTEKNTRREVEKLHAQPDVAPVVTTRTPAPENTTEEDTQKNARETLSEIATRRKEEKTPSRDIEFTLPTFDKKESENLRTLRNDAIEDVEEKQLSVARIAAAEEKRKDREGRTEERRGFPYKPVAVAAILALTLSGAAAGGYIWFTGKEDAPQVTTTIAVPSFVRSTTQTAIPFSGNRSALVAAMNDAKNATTGTSGDIVQLYPSVQTEFGASPVATDVFMSVFDPRAPGTFIRSLENDMMFGVYFGADREPFFVFKTTRFDTAFAGMLAWEETMSTDLSPIFGTPVRRTLDPTARTLTNTRTAFFVDETIRNRSVRVLYDENGSERLVYSFIDTETIVITTSAESLIELIERL